MALTKKQKIIGSAIASVAIAAIMAGQSIDSATRSALADRFARRNEQPLTLEERDAWFAAVNADLKRCPTKKFNAQDPDAILDELNELVRRGC
jgi:hypothetical protein